MVILFGCLVDIGRPGSPESFINQRNQRLLQFDSNLPPHFWLPFTFRPELYVSEGRIELNDVQLWVGWPLAPHVPKTSN